eukprot:m.55050 g.55050  ORF g.55050 m.55050 type:complete len:513 (+) comp11110_c0_seq1:68-1606(+)
MSDNVQEYHPHPLGVVPGGVVTHSTTILQRVHDGLGAFAGLGDDLLLDILSKLDAESLATMCLSSKPMYVFASTEDLWRPLFLKELGEINKTKGKWTFLGDWKSTLIELKLQQRRQIPHAEDGLTHSPHQSRAVSLSLPSIPSETLFSQWLNSTAGIDEEWLKHDNVPRVEGATLSAKQFADAYERPQKPVVITGLANEWRAKKTWTKEELGEVFGTQLFDAFDEYSGSYKMTMKQYLCYARHQRDERPLYIFDPNYIENGPTIANSYAVPSVFPQCHLAVLGDKRPPWRWLLAGPARTGTNFHVDPNHTAAWNTIIYGRKKWILFPPSVLPPGVFLQFENEEDAGTCAVDQPDNVMAWFMQWYDDIKHIPEYANSVQECVCEEGDTMFIPDGWWHLVLNLEETVAITHNFVSDNNLQRCLNFLDTGLPPFINRAGPEDINSLLRQRLSPTSLSTVTQSSNDPTLSQRQPQAMFSTKRKANNAHNSNINHQEDGSNSTKKKKQTTTFSFNFS